MVTMTLCSQCECLIDDHFNPIESDDPLIIIQVRRGSTPLNCCGECGECEWDGYSVMPYEEVT